MLVLGIDGCRDGWFVVALREGAFHFASFAPTVAHALDAHPDARVVAIDIPIGSEPDRFRSVDAEARKRLGSRSSTIFETPPLAVLRQPDFASAVSLCRALTGKGLSQQSYALRTKTLEVAPVADRDDRIIEVHPELSFSVLAGGVIPASKKSWDGLMRRRLLLEQAGIRLPEALGESAGRVGPDDVLDAAVAAWTAERKRRGLADHVGAAAGSGGRGSPSIWF
jgi:predicted RNase H-like nuclease